MKRHKSLSNGTPARLLQRSMISMRLRGWTSWMRELQKLKIGKCGRLRVELGAVWTDPLLWAKRCLRATGIFVNRDYTGPNTPGSQRIRSGNLHVRKRI
jgi:hypothetical protein